MRVWTLLFLLISISYPVYAVDKCAAVYGTFTPQFKTLSDYEHPLFGLVHSTLVELQPQVKVLIQNNAQSPSLQTSIVRYAFLLKMLFKHKGKIVFNSSSEKVESDPSVNCHGYTCAASNIQNLPNGWLQRGTDHSKNETVDSVKNVIEHYFTKIKSFEKSEEQKISNDFDIQSGDVITYLSEGEYTHSGFVVRSTDNNQIFIRSKMGYTFTFDLRPDKMKEIFDYSQIIIWRRNNIP